MHALNALPLIIKLNWFGLLASRYVLFPLFLFMLISCVADFHCWVKHSMSMFELNPNTYYSYLKIEHFCYIISICLQFRKQIIRFYIPKDNE